MIFSVLVEVINEGILRMGSVFAVVYLIPGTCPAVHALSREQKLMIT